MSQWYDEYKKLDLLQGKIKFICQDDEDMLEIRYKDGMLIDVGYLEEDQSYYVTVILDENDDENGWVHPLEEIEVKNKGELFGVIQQTIYKYRKS